MRTFIRIIVIFCLGVLPVAAAPKNLTFQRAAFLQAENALRHGQSSQFLIFSNLLRNYVLYPYLIYDSLSLRLPQLPEKEVASFLQTYADTPLADRLRDQWLMVLATQKQWPLFLKYYQTSDSAVLQCNYVQALLNTGNTAAAFHLLPTLWQSGATQPAGCEPAFVLWYKSGAVSQALIWQRVRLAIASGNSAVLNELAAWSSPAQQAQIKLWQKVSKNPALVSKVNLFQPLSSNMQEIVVDGFMRWAKANPQQLSGAWSQLKDSYHFNAATQQKIQAAIAVGLARSNDPNAASWLATVNLAAADQVTQEWGVRTALAKQNWPLIIARIKQLSPQDQAKPIWRYWSARALAAQGQVQAAQTIYSDLAKQVDYYGLLASQQLKQAYAPANFYLPVSASTLDEVAALPAIQRAGELYALERAPDARREWQWALDEMTAKQLAAATQLAYQWRWYDRALVTAAKAGDWNDLDVRFPLAYRAEIVNFAKQIGLNPAWAYAIMRQESNFMADAKSSVGAIGLMQLMPNTARIFAKFNVNEYELLDSATNINLGTQYLKQLAGWYNGNLVMATAAYNLGPTRLKKWLPLYKVLPTDIWVEILPWQETRNYVKAILLNMAIYQKKLAG